MRIKVCGMTLPEQVNSLDEMGVQYAGFIFYPKSQRYVGNRISPQKMKDISRQILKVGVFVNTPYDELMETVDNYGLDMVQLHGDEPAHYCAQVANHITVIKAFRLMEDDPLERMLEIYEDSCHFFLYDTLGSGYGGTGKKFNWDQLRNTTLNKKYFLSGVIEPGDVEQLKSFSKEPVAEKLLAVDINSRFEISPGVKNLKKVQFFLNELRVEKS